MKRVVSHVTGHTALLQRDDIDTDALFPGRFLRLSHRSGMGRYLFADWREAGQPESAFMDDAETARILVAPQNFGCGSSREHAVWALADYGVEAVVALSFGDIFRNNCVKNDIVAATVTEADHALLAEALRQPGAHTLHLDVAARRLRVDGDGIELPFELVDGHAEQLLSAEDPISRTLRFEPALRAHEARVLAEKPWLAAIE